MYYERYAGSFLSIGNVTWTCKIMQVSDSAFQSVGELHFPSDRPLEIEWQHRDKEEPVCGSVATLTLLSPSDRTYMDLYTIVPGNIRLDVYRNNVIYWSGCLDTEFYSEPYSSAKNYNVQLIFSDLGILDRLKYNLTGIQTYAQIISDILGRSNVNYSALSTKISTNLGGSALTMNRIAMRSENFYDEDGEAMTLYDVLSGLLQPLALKIIQRNGKFWIYDINALSAEITGVAITWASNDQQMDVDKVANNIKVTLSVYDGDVKTKDVTYTGEYAETMINLDNTGTYFSYYPNYDSNWDYQNVSFTIFTSQTEASGLAAINSQLSYFHILPLLGGQAASGVAHMFYSGGHGPLSGGRPQRKGGLTLGTTDVMRTERLYLPKLNSTEAAKYQIKVLLEALLDPRYNPFEEAGEYNEEDASELFESYANNVQIPVKIQLFNSAGTVIYHYKNSSIYNAEGLVGTLANAIGSWVAGGASGTDAKLQWYDPSDPDKCACMGWKGNRQAMGFKKGELSESFKSIADGQYIPYPPDGGYLEVTVLTGLTINDDNLEKESSDFTNKLRWVLLKAPIISIVYNSVLHSEIQAQDAEYSGTLNLDAKEAIELDTICGTMAKVSPVSRSLILQASDNTPVTSLTRAGRTGTAEELLIGTLYSQYAGRKTKLKGTSYIDAGDLKWRSDAAQPSGTKFMMLASVQDVIMDEDNIEVVEFSGDNYTTS